MHRRTDLWGPDGIITTSKRMINWLIHVLSSPRIRSWSLPGWKSEEIFNPKPLHFLSFQRRTSHLSGTTGIVALTTHFFVTVNIGNSVNVIFFFVSQFAYHEATFFLIRLFQQFTGFALDNSANIKTPADWATCDGLKATEKVYPAAHLTMFVRVSVLFLFFFWEINDTFVVLSGRPLGTDGAAEVVERMSSNRWFKLHSLLYFKLNFALNLLAGK